MQKKLLVIPIVASIVVSIVALALLVNFSDPEREARELYEKALGLYEDKEYSLAVEKAEMLRTEYPGSNYESEACGLLCIAYSEWSEELAKTGNYEDAIEKLQTMLDKKYYYLSKKYGLTEDLVTNRIITCFYDWGIRLQGEKKFEESLEKYKLIVEKYPEVKLLQGFSYDLAGECIASTYYEWGTFLEEQGRYEEAIEKYLLIIDNRSEYRIPLEYSWDAEEKWIPAGYLSWAERLKEQGRYEEAIEKLNEVIETVYSHSDEGKEARNGLQSCYYEWATDLVREGDFNEALQKYSILIEEYFADWEINRNTEKAEALLSKIPVEVLFTSAAEFRELGKFNTGITLYKGIARFHKESEYVQDAIEAAIDTEMDKIYSYEERGSLSTPSGEEKELGGLCEITIINDSPYQLEIFFSGPETTSFFIQDSPDSPKKRAPPFPFDEPPVHAERLTFTIDPGEYRVGIHIPLYYLVGWESSGAIPPSYGEWTLTINTSYEIWFYVIGF